MRLAFLIALVDGEMEGAIEVFGIGKGVVGEVMPAVRRPCQRPQLDPFRLAGRDPRSHPPGIPRLPAAGPWRTRQPSARFLEAA